MASQDFPLDLTVRKTEEHSTDHDGVLDLSTKSRRNLASSSLRTSHGSMATPLIKGDLSLAKARDLQSTSTLEQFMAKLCLHHQQQIVDALDFLQTEVKAVVPTHSLSAPAPTVPSRTFFEVDSSSPTHQLNVVSNTGKSSTVGPPGVMDCSTSVLQITTQEARVLDNVGGPCPPPTHPKALDVCRVSSGAKGDLMVSLPGNSDDGENVCHYVAASVNKNKNSGSLVNFSSMFKTGNPDVGTLEEQQCNSESSLGQSKSPGRVNQSSVRHKQGFGHLCEKGQSDSHGNAKDVLVGPCSLRKISKTSLNKARKSAKMPSPQPMNTPVCQLTNKPDSHYDFVYVTKHITECKLQHQHRMPIRQNARKSTRGHMYLKDIWELKTIRIGPKSCANENGEYSAPMPETNTLVTPIQLLSKPDGVPPVDIPFAGGCEEAVSQKEPGEESMEREMVDEDVAGESELVTESIQTEQQVSSPTKAPFAINQESPKTSGQEEEAELEMDISASILKSSCILSQVVPEESNKHQPGSTQEEVQTVQLPEVSSDLAAIAPRRFKSNDMSVEESQNDSAVSIPSLSASFIVEHSFETEDDGSGNKLDKDVQPQKLPLVEILEENVENIAGIKEDGEKEKVEMTELLCQAVGDFGAQLHAQVSTGNAEKVTAKESDPVLKNSKELKEVVTNTSGRINTKSGSDGRVSASDRCLRSRTKTSSSDSSIKSQTEVKGLSKINIDENCGMNSPSRPVFLEQKEDAVLRLVSKNSETLEKTGSSDCKPELFSVGKTNELHVDGVMWTRKKHKSVLTKEVENNEVMQGQADKDMLQLPSHKHDERVISKMCPTAPSMVAEGPARSDSMGSAMEVPDKIPPGSICRSDGMAKKSISYTAPLKQDFGSQKFAILRPDEKKQIYSRVKTGVQKCIQTQKKDSDPFGLQKLDLSGSNLHNFLETLVGEENQQLITDLNSRYDKMQMGWIQMDKAGQYTAAKPKNKADRLKEIWKTKRRIRKAKSSDQPKSSPVHMLFMKPFEMSSICRWFLQTTETKSLVIVKKANTRLPSETQLCFHSSSVGSSSQGVFPSLQAERLKKHLKKFAIASPVKSNPKNQKLISKVWEQEGCCNKGKEKTNELTTATRMSTKPRNLPQQPETQVMENQKGSVTARRPASARILKKYSNIRGKLQVQQHALKPKGMLEEDVRVNLIRSSKLGHSPKSPLKQKKKGTSAGENCGANKSKYAPSTKRLAGKVVSGEKGVQNNNRSSTGLKKKDTHALKRSSMSSAAQKLKEQTTPNLSVSSRLKNKTEVPIKVEKEPVEVPKPVQVMETEIREAKVQKKKTVKNIESVASQQKVEFIPVSQDQVLTRSQRKNEAMPNRNVSSKSAMKRTQDPLTSSAKRTRTSLLK